MSKVRMTDEVLQQKRAELAGWKERVRRWELLKAAQDTEPIKLLMESSKTVQKMIHTGLVRLALNSTISKDDAFAQLRYMGGQLHVVEMFMGDFTRLDAQIDAGREHVERIAQELKTTTAETVS